MPTPAVPMCRRCPSKNAPPTGGRDRCRVESVRAADGKRRSEKSAGSRPTLTAKGNGGHITPAEQTDANGNLMNYTGKLYGKGHGRTYFPLVLTSEDVDRMEKEHAAMKAALQEMIRRSYNETELRRMAREALDSCQNADVDARRDEVRNQTGGCSPSHPTSCSHSSEPPMSNFPPVTEKGSPVGDEIHQPEMAVDLSGVPAGGTHHQNTIP
jgi:hypothetical protein